MTVIDLIGYFAAIGTTGSFIPQAIKVFKTRSTNDLSLGTYLFFNMGVVFWGTYGVLVNSVPMILANGITFIMSFYILTMIIKHKREKHV